MRARPAVRPIIAGAAVVMVLLAGCSASGSDTSSVTTSTTKTTSTSSGPSTTATITAPPTRKGPPPPPETTQPSAPPDGSGLTLRPVIGSQLCSSVTPDAPADGPQSTATTIPDPGRPELVPAADDVLCYGLGPVAATGEDLARADADADAQTGGWTVLVTAKDDGKVKLNTLFDACAAGAVTCPAGEGGTGQVAIELDGKVISAPSIQSRGLASSPFQISAGFTQQEAQTLAARLNG